MGGYKHKPSAAALATPYTELTLALTPSSGTPSSILHDATLDAGLLNGWVVGNPESKLTGAVDNGTTQDLVLAQDNLAGAFTASVRFEIAPNGGHWTFGVAIFQKEPTSVSDQPYAYSGFGRTGSTTLVGPRATLYGINSSTESSTDANISCGAGVEITAHLEVDADGKIRMYYTPDGGSKTEHGAPSGDYINTVGSPFRSSATRTTRAARRSRFIRSM